MGSWGQEDIMERKEMPLFTRINPSLSIWMNFNLTEHERSLTLLQ